MKETIKSMNALGFKTLASCCGHSKYEPTIISKYGKDNYEII